MNDNILFKFNILIPIFNDISSKLFQWNLKFSLKIVVIQFSYYCYKNINY